MNNSLQKYKEIKTYLLNGDYVTYDLEEGSILFALAKEVNEKCLANMLKECGQLQLVTTDLFKQKKKINSFIIPWSTKNIKKSITAILDKNINDIIADEQSVLITFEEKLLPRLNHWQANLLEFIADFSDIPLLLIGKKLTVEPSHNIMTKEMFSCFRAYNKTLISQVGITKLKLLQGEFELYSFYSQIDQHYHWAFVKNHPNENIPLVRIESECLTGHVLGSLLCDCSAQLQEGLKTINNYGYGALIYLRQEGRGIGLDAKLQAYYMQQFHNMDTVDANLAVGVPEEARDYIIGAQILHHLSFQKCQILTNNPNKITGLKQYGITIDKQVSHIIPASKHNRKYLETKRDRMGHLIDERLN